MTKAIINLDAICDHLPLIEEWEESYSVLDDLVADDCVPFNGPRNERMIAFNVPEAKFGSVVAAARALGAWWPEGNHISTHTVIERIIEMELNMLANKDGGEAE